MIGQLCTFAELEELVFRFEELLNRHNIEITPDSQLGRASLAVLAARLKNEKPEARDESVDIRIELGYALGLWEFMKKVVRLEKHPDFTELVPHLQEMNQGGFLQNLKAGNKELTDQTPAKMFELLIAMSAMDIGENVKLDHPKNPKGDNPDVIATIGGIRWSFACKMMMGSSPISLFDRIQDGVKQIVRVARPNGPVERGMVVISLKNRIDYDQFWPILNEEDFNNGEEPVFGAHLDLSPVVNRLKEIVAAEVKAMVDSATEEKVLKLFDHPAVSPSVPFFLQLPMSVATQLGAVPIVYTFLWPHRFRETSESDDLVSEALYEALHNRRSRDVTKR